MIIAICLHIVYECKLLKALRIYLKQRANYHENILFTFGWQIGYAEKQIVQDKSFYWN